MTTTRFLTGITPSGTPHLGNYAGMMRPAIAATRTPGVENFYFLADYTTPSSNARSPSAYTARR